MNHAMKHQADNEPEEKFGCVEKGLKLYIGSQSIVVGW